MDAANPRCTKSLPTRRRQKFRYSLRTLLLLATAAAVILGVWANRAERQRRAVAAIYDLRGKVAYDFEWRWESGTPSSPFSTPHESSVHEWLHKFLGVDYCADADFVLMPRTTTDEGLMHLSALYKLHWLDLGATRITDAGLMHLCELKNLKHLGLCKTQVSDIGIMHLRGVDGLQSLDLVATNVTDAGLVHVGGLKNLWGLYLSRTRMTDAGLTNLSGLSKLHFLDLSETQITDASLVHLRGFGNLEYLDLSKTQVTDVGLKYLSDLKNL